LAEYQIGDQFVDKTDRKVTVNRAGFAGGLNS
jgi:hypothetical protein